MGSDKQVGRRGRYAFSSEFKAEAVRMAGARQAAGTSLTQIGRELDVCPDHLRAWVLWQRKAAKPEAMCTPPSAAHRRSWSARISSSRATWATHYPSVARRSCISRTASALNSARNARRSRRPPNSPCSFFGIKHLRPESRTSEVHTKTGQSKSSFSRIGKDQPAM
jgi:transposase-like protein